MYAEFTDDLITGNEMIDSQHKELIGRMNKLLESCELGNEKTIAVNTLDYLSEYTDFHFSAEEKLQQEINYPGFEKHKAQHEIFKQTIKELEEMLTEEEGPSNAFVQKVQENIVKWFYTHIETFDRSVAEYKFMRENNERL